MSSPPLKMVVSPKSDSDSDGPVSKKDKNSPGEPTNSPTSTADWVVLDRRDDVSTPAASDGEDAEDAELTGILLVLG
jgi:hypothetical protein